MGNSGNITDGVRRDPGPSARLISNVLGVVGLVIIGLVLYYLYNVWLVFSDNAGTFHHTSTVVDVDGDGTLDIVMNHVRNEAEFTAFSVIVVWSNQGDGRFVARNVADMPGGEPGWASGTGDIDRDGDVDLLIFPGHRLRILFNQGGDQEGQPGTFGPGARAHAPVGRSQFGSLLPGDVDGDGQLDVVITGCCGRVFTLAENDDTPNYAWLWRNRWASGERMGQSSVISALDGLALRDAALGDLDGDRDLDLFAAVIAQPQGRNRNAADRVIFNDGDGNFADSGQRLGQSDSTTVALGDVDGDGDLDALVGKEYGARVWSNQGRVQGGEEGTFEPTAQPFGRRATTATFLSDLDGDGHLDALIGNRRQATIWWNDGQGTFTASGQRFRYRQRHGLAVGDFNGDGRPDIFAGRYTDGYRVWFNEGQGTFGQQR